MLGDLPEIAALTLMFNSANCKYPCHKCLIENDKLNNTTLNPTDVVVPTIKSGNTSGAYQVWIDSMAANSCVIAVRNISAGSLSEAVIISFSVVKAVTS